MIVIKTGTEEWREMSQKEIRDMIQKALGEDFDPSKKNAFEFKMRQHNDQLNRRKVSPKLIINNVFTARLEGRTVRIGYCKYTDVKQQGGIAVTELMPKISRDLGLIIDKKTLLVPGDELDRFLYLLIYPQCQNSPFTKSARTYSFYDPVATSKKNIVTLKQQMEVQNGILNSYSEDRLRAYLASKGNKKADKMDEDVMRMEVMKMAQKDLAGFVKDFNAGNIGVTADAKRLLDTGWVALHDSFGRKEFKISKGDAKGETLAILEHGRNEIQTLANALTTNPTMYEYLKKAMSEVISSKKDGEQEFTDEEKEMLDKVTLDAPRGKVYRRAEPGSRKKLPESKEYTVVSKMGWQREFLDYLKTDEGASFFE